MIFARIKLESSAEINNRPENCGFQLWGSFITVQSVSTIYKYKLLLAIRELDRVIAPGRPSKITPEKF